MEENVQEALQRVGRAEADLGQSIAAREGCSGLEALLSKLRYACQDLFFLDLQLAETKDVENRLWRSHQDVNKEFRAYLGSLRREENKKKTVERRKADKLYLDFIKSSHRFYRGFIQRICSHFTGLGEIYEIARKMHLETLSADTPIEVDTAQKNALLRSCHMTLIQCGDLSRWRENELSHKERNWGPAKGYYECAAQLDPRSGHSFNQLSVMALADGDHFRALYYIYRTLATANPFPAAAGNLSIELKKISTKSIKAAGTETKLGDAEVPFLKLHAMIYTGESFINFRSDCDQLMMKLSEVVQEQPCNKSLKRLCLINIAASHQAEKMARSPPSGHSYSIESLAQTWRMAQALNASMFTLLLLVSASELRAISRDAIELAEDMVTKARLLTPICRRTLPCLRVYTGWLLTEVGTLLKLGELPGEPDLCLHSLWEAFVGCINELMAIFPINKIPDIPYLLDEDEDMLHFTPLGPAVSGIYFCDTLGSIKPHRDQAHSIRTVPAERPDYEMLQRIKGLVTVGAYFHKHRLDYSTQVPLYMAGNAFRLESPTGHGTSPNPTPGSQLANSYGLTNSLELHDHTSLNSTSYGNQADAMADMVDDLVGAERHMPRNTSQSKLNSSPSIRTAAGISNSRPSSAHFNASDFVRQMSQPGGSPVTPAFSTPIVQPQHRSSFGAIYQTPFAPLPGELSNVTNSRPGTSHNSSPRIGHQGSSAAFKEDLNRRQRELSERSSPHRSLDPPPLSTISNTPTGFYTFAQAASRPTFQELSPSSPYAPTEMEVTDSPRKRNGAAAAAAAGGPSFGAIGDGRAKAVAKTPTSAQPG